MTRRALLRLAAGSTLGARFLGHDAPALPRVNGGINIQPLRRFEAGPGRTQPLIVPELVDLQLRAVYELGFDALRITISFNRFGPDFLAAIPYVRAARALGIHVLGVMADFAGFDLVQALTQPRTRAEVLAVYRMLFAGTVVPASSAVDFSGSFALQVLNEPTHFLGVAAESYVGEFLAPVYQELKAKEPGLIVVSGAEVGSIDGVLRLRPMFEAGLERYCDRVAYHVYSRRLIPLLTGLATRPVWITESGVAGTENHLGWVAEVFGEIRRQVVGVERIYFFELFDFEPRRFRLLDIVPDPNSGFRARSESDALLAYWTARVRDPTGGLPHATYRDLIPDITAYFPTRQDLDLIASTSFGRP